MARETFSYSIVQLTITLTKWAEYGSICNYIYIKLCNTKNLIKYCFKKNKNRADLFEDGQTLKNTLQKIKPGKPKFKY